MNMEAYPASHSLRDANRDAQVRQGPSPTNHTDMGSVTAVMLKTMKHRVF
jgi:hypothetical protein